jgi:hypothetical protein
MRQLSRNVFSHPHQDMGQNAGRLERGSNNAGYHHADFIRTNSAAKWHTSAGEL